DRRSDVSSPRVSRAQDRLASLDRGYDACRAVPLRDHHCRRSELPGVRRPVFELERCAGPPRDRVSVHSTAGLDARRVPRAPRQPEGKETMRRITWAALLLGVVAVTALGGATGTRLPRFGGEARAVTERPLASVAVAGAARRTVRRTAYADASAVAAG